MTTHSETRKRDSMDIINDMPAEINIINPELRVNSFICILHPLVLEFAMVSRTLHIKVDIGRTSLSVLRNIRFPGDIFNNMTYLRVNDKRSLCPHTMI